MLRSRHFCGERRDLLLTRATFKPGSGVTNVAITDASVGADQPDGLRDFFRRAEHQVIQADRIDAELFGDVDHLVERLEALVRDGRVDADAQRRVLAPRGLLQPPQPFAGPLERALQSARASCSSPGPSIETLMCFRKPAAARSASASARSSLMIVPLVVR